MIYLMGIIILLLIVLFIIIYDISHFVVRSYELESEKIEKTYKMVVLSDLHGKSFGSENEKLFNKIKQINPDDIYIAGDMLTAVKGKDFTKVVSFIKKLADEYHIYYGSGNHEYRLLLYPEKYGSKGEEYENAIVHDNIDRLKNKSVDVKDFNITVYGAEIEREYYRKWKMTKMSDDYLKTLLGAPDSEKYNIVIAHNPVYFDQYLPFGADLYLAGHLHGGIARLPFFGGVIAPSFRLFPKYDGGLVKKENATMIVSRGLGCHTIPVRFLNPCELVEITIRPKK